MIILDTNVVIEFAQSEPHAVSWIEKQRARDERFGISTLSVIEILGYPKARSEDLWIVERTLRFFSVYPVDLSIAHQAAIVRRRYGLKTVDSAIAATALIHGLPLASRDRGFRKITELELIVP